MVRKRSKLIFITPFISGIVFLVLLTFIHGCGRNFAGNCIGEYCLSSVPSFDLPTQDDDASNPIYQGVNPEGGLIGDGGAGRAPRRISFADEQKNSPMQGAPGG